MRSSAIRSRRAPQYAVAANGSVGRSNVASERRTFRSERFLRARSCVPLASASPIRFCSAKNASRYAVFCAAVAHRDFFLQLSWYHPETRERDAAGEDARLSVRALASRARRLARREDRLSAGRCGHSATARNGVRCIRTSRAVAASFLAFRSRRRLARRTRRMGTLDGRRRSRACDRKLAMDRRRRCRHGAISAHLQSRTAAPAVRSERDLRAPLGGRVATRYRWPLERRAEWTTRSCRSRSFPTDAYPPPVVDHAAAARGVSSRAIREFASALREPFVEPVADDRNANVVAVPRLDAEVDAADEEDRNEQRHEDVR